MDITGLILAGGRGTRMGGVDKGLTLFQAQPMALHALNRLRPQVQQLMINANQNLSVYAAWGVPVWPDAMPDFAGPLAGLQTGLMHCTTPYLVTAPCDSPFLPSDLVQRLSNGLQAQAADLAFAVTTEEGRHQRHPVFCLVKCSLLPQLSAFLDNGGRKVDAWFRSLAVAEVHFVDAQAFRNINTPDELRMQERLPDGSTHVSTDSAPPPDMNAP